MVNRMRGDRPTISTAIRDRALRATDVAVVITDAR